MIGKTLSHYRITAKLGEGGMGEVYRAEDERLERDVAVKILPESVSGSPHFRARFEREARTISSLSHPHICTLFDVGEESGTHFLVMELLEGESLAERLEKGPLPIEQVLGVGAQVAEALAAAHRQGIVHRDLKPGNVMLTKNGAKLLDFGLARAGAEAAPIQGLSQLATEEQPLTAEGTIVGTFRYMAPEQLEGLETDARTDIFALGALLYEMATGRPAFNGDTRTSLIAAIVSSQPEPISSVVPLTPPTVDHVVSRCLEKEPDDRWQSAHDIAGELRWIAATGSQAGVPAAAAPTGQVKRGALLAAAVVGWIAALVAIAHTFLAPSRRESVDTVLRADLAQAEEAPYLGVIPGRIQLSPLGDRLVFITGVDARRMLATRDLATGEISILEGSEDAIFPFWSPDGHSIGFFADQKLKKMPSVGGPVQILAEAPQGRGGSWSDEDQIVYSPRLDGPLMLISAQGGTPTAVTEANEEYTSHRNPEFLPDGEHFLFNRKLRETATWDIAVGSVEGIPSRVVVENAATPQWSQGMLWFVRDGNLLTQRFDPSSLAVEGPATALAGQIGYYDARGLANFSASRSGLLVYRQSPYRRTQVAWTTSSGDLIEAVGGPFFSNERPSPTSDASAISVTLVEPSTGEHDVWLIDTESGQRTRVTSMRAPSLGAVLSPEGDQLLITDFSNLELWTRTVADPTPRATLQGVHFIPQDWSPDGRYVIGYTSRSEQGSNISYIDLEAGGELHDYLATPAAELGARFSPDGRWVAYQSDEMGFSRVYVSSFPDHARTVTVSEDVGFGALWSSDTDSLFYIGREGLFEVPVEVGETVEIGDARLLAPMDRLEHISRFVAHVGGRFLAISYPEDPVPQPLRLVLGWQQLVAE